VVELAALEML